MCRIVCVVSSRRRHTRVALVTGVQTFALPISRRSHLRWLMSDDAQRGFIPANDGQPSRRAAWHDPAVNARWGNFYRNTAATLEAAYVRPRHDGAIAFQTEAAALIRDGLDAGTPHAALLDRLQAAYSRSRKPLPTPFFSPSTVPSRRSPSTAPTSSTPRPPPWRTPSSRPRPRSTTATRAGASTTTA